MKPISILFSVWKILSIVSILAATAVAFGQPADTSNSASPIQINNVPITSAIDSLARLSGINYILDSKLSS